MSTGGAPSRLCPMQRGSFVTAIRPEAGISPARAPLKYTFIVFPS